MSDEEFDILPLLDELHIVARTGLTFAADHHDEARYERILELVHKSYGRTLDRPSAEVREKLAERVGFVTPYVAAGTAIFDDNGRILLMKRADDGTWDLPKGAADPSESPRETARRETREETGLEVRPTRPIETYFIPAHVNVPHGSVLIVYACEVTGGSLRLSEEGTDLRYWNLEDVPAWNLQAREWAADAYEWWSER